MPKLSQPSRLQKIAFDCLVEHVVNRCNDQSAEGFLTKLRQGVIHIKEQVRNQLSGSLFVDFCQRFFERFHKLGLQSLKERPASHHKAVLEIIMDVEIVGLKCSGRIMHYLDPRDAQRLKRPETLDWTELQFCKLKSRGLENFQLKNLTTFIFPKICTDQDLEVVGSSCPKLQVLMIQESFKVTDRGLRALNSCGELRVLNLHYCRVSDDGINGLLSLHSKIEEFNIARYYLKGEKNFDVLSRPSSMVCPSMKRFCFHSSPVKEEDLRSIVTLFPNLVYLRIASQLMGDLTVLRYLNKLTELNFSCGNRSFRMENLKRFLSIVGENITILNMLHCNPEVCVNQDDINAIFKFCRNIQSLGFDFEPVEDMEKLVIPPFEKLKKFECSTLTRYSGSPVVLEFGKMPALEDLKVHGFHLTLKMVESMMLDNTKFPNLKILLIPYASEEDVDHVMQIARSKNLDFIFKNSFWEHIV